VAKKNMLSNGLVEARFDRRGLLARLLVNGADTLSGAPCLIAYRDVPYDLEAWEIDRQVLDTGKPLTLCDAGRVENGPGWAGIVQRWTHGESTVDVLWKLRAGSLALEIELKVNWSEPECLLRFEVPTPFRGQTALFGAAFGGEWRLQQPGDPRQSAQWEVPANRWVMAADDGRQEGAFLLAEAKYGFSARDGVIGVSLLKSAKVTTTTAFPPAFRSGPKRCPWSDFGKHTIRLALGRLSVDSPREAYPAVLADTIFAEPLRVPASEGRPVQIAPSIEGMPSFSPLWAVPVDKDRWVLRLHETLGRKGEARITAPAGWRMSLLEKALPGADDKSLAADTKIAVSPFAYLSISFSRNTE
jgi:alpha-mannosidase